MYVADDSEHPIDSLLADALVLADYDHSQAPTAAERIARAAARSRRDEVVCESTHSGPDRYACSQQLDLICARVLNTLQAAASLSRFEITNHAEPEGALVFACLLHLVGSEQGAQFWWKFAAGSDIPDAAECLLLHYESNGDDHDALRWREEWQRLQLIERQDERELELAPAARHPLLPEHVAKQLIEQCLRGLRPKLPPSLREAVDSLVVESDDESFGRIPRPRQRPDALGVSH